MIVRRLSDRFSLSDWKRIVSSVCGPCTGLCLGTEDGTGRIFDDASAESRTIIV